MTDWRPAVEKHKGPFFLSALRQDNCLYLESKSLKNVPFLSVYFVANHWFVFHFQTSALSFSTATVYFFKSTDSSNFLMTYFTTLCSLQLCRHKFSFRFVRKTSGSSCSDKGLRGILERLVNIPAKML